MELAKFWSETKNSCYSRHVGAIIVDPMKNQVLGSGYNGPCKQCPRCDSKEFLDWLWDNLKFYNITVPLTKEQLDNLQGKKVCPRKALLNAASGTWMEICQAEHAERNAIHNAIGRDLHGSWMFAFCPIPCHECMKAIAQVGIKRVFCLKANGPDYSPLSRFIAKNSGVTITLLDANYGIIEEI